MEFNLVVTDVCNRLLSTTHNRADHFRVCRETLKLSPAWWLCFLGGFCVTVTSLSARLLP